jgi:predicted dehydrogenase
MTNWGAHHLDIVQWALSADESGPTRIEGTATHDPEKRFEVPASSKVTFTYADGTIVHCEQGDTDWKGGVEFLGENGSFFVSREELRVDPPTLLHPVMAPHLFGVETSNDHYANWLDAIKSRARPICDVAVGHRSASVCHLANIACRLGRPLEWDPRAEQFVYDSEAQAFLSRPYRSPYRLPEIPA